MTNIYRLVTSGCYAGGLLLMLLGILTRLVAPLARALPFSARGLLMLAATLYLGAIASREMQGRT